MVKQKCFHRDWGAFEFFIYCSFFNPFKKRIIGEIVPIFNILPQLGISFDNQNCGNSYHVGIFICFLNFEFKVYFNIWFKITNVNIKK